MEQSSRRSGLAPEIGVLAVVAAASLPLARLFQEPAPGQVGFGTVEIAAIVLSGAVAWGLRRIRLPVLLSAVVSALGFFWFAAALFHTRSLFGPFPSPESVNLVLDSLQAGMRAVATEAAPVVPSASFLCLAALGIWATVWLADDAAIRLRHPLLAIGLALPIFAMPGTLIRAQRGWVDVALFCFSALLLLFLDERARLARWAGGGVRSWQPGLAGRLGVIAVVLGVLAAPILPGYSQPPGGSLRAATGTRVTVNPLVAVRPSLNESPIASLFRVRSRTPLYWRLTALDRFDGNVWTATPESARLSPGRDGVQRSSPAPRTVRVEQEYLIDNLAGPWVPAAFEPVRVEDIRGVSMQATSRTMLASRGFRTGQAFRVISEVPAPIGEELNADDGPDPDGERYTALPFRMPAFVALEALRITSGASTRLERAIAIQSYLRTFTYDEDVALHHGVIDLVEFLRDVKKGYCEQFASAMAVLARTLGIPARVVVGFGTGEPGRTPDEYLVTSRQAHAWTEIHFAGHGWIAFEPTPRSGGFAPPSYTTTGVAQSPVDPSPTASPGAVGPSPTTGPAERDRAENVDAGANADARGGLPVLPVGLGVVLVGAAAALPGAALVRRRRRRARAKTPSELVGVRYVEFLEWCRGVALGRSTGETPLEHAGRVGRVQGVATPEPLRVLALAATEAVYADAGGQADPAAAEHAAREARTALAVVVPRWRKIRTRAGWAWWTRV